MPDMNCFNALSISLLEVIAPFAIIVIFMNWYYRRMIFRVIADSEAAKNDFEKAVNEIRDNYEKAFNEFKDKVRSEPGFVKVQLTVDGRPLDEVIQRNKVKH